LPRVALVYVHDPIACNSIALIDFFQHTALDMKPPSASIFMPADAGINFIEHFTSAGEH
jgi:hypothetical protein